MTLGEVQKLIDVYIENKELEAKQCRANAYNTSYLTACFVGLVLNGQKIPSYENVFEGEAVQQQDDEVREAFLKEQLLDFARNANKQRRQKECL